MSLRNGFLWYNDEGNYWLASEYMGPSESNAIWGLREVRGSFVRGSDLWNSFYGATNSDNGVRAVVSLKSNLQITKGTTDSYRNNNIYNLAITIEI